MHIISKKPLIDHWTEYPDCKNQLATWFKIVSKGSWQSTNQLKENFSKSSILKNNRMVFRIKSYRLVVQFAFNTQRCFIRWVGTHDDYDRIDANTI